MPLPLAKVQRSISFILALGAASGASPGAANLTAFLAGGGVVPDAVTYTARVQVTQMFREIGIDIDWHRQPSTAAPAGIRVMVATGRPEADHPHSLAYTTPYTRSPVITVNYDRLQRAVAGRPALLPMLLAHVLAHEIGHILKGNDDHAEVGVMKARWTDADYDEMTKKPLSFTTADQRLMRMGLGLPGQRSEP